MIKERYLKRDFDELFYFDEFWFHVFDELSAQNAFSFSENIRFQRFDPAGPSHILTIYKKLI